MLNEINCGSSFYERIVLKKDDGEMLAYVPDRTCKPRIDPWLEGRGADYYCGGCGAPWGESRFGRFSMPKYCPNCRARVVADE